MCVVCLVYVCTHDPFLQSTINPQVTGRNKTWFLSSFRNSPDHQVRGLSTHMHTHTHAWSPSPLHSKGDTHRSRLSWPQRCNE